ncbi:MAG: EVE domain-containing protein [Spongiibacteraceae bacterium]
MSGWLFKIEPSELSIDDLAARGARGVCWDGVRNYQARNMLRDQIRLGDKVFIYHSSCAEVGIAGIGKVIRAAYPDPSQFDPDSKYADPASKPEQPRWISVDVRHEETFPEILSLAALKANPALAEMALVQRGNRLSVMPVTTAQWRAILSMKRANKL